MLPVTLKKRADDQAFQDEAKLVEEAKHNPGGPAESQLLTKYLPAMYGIAQKYMSYDGTTYKSKIHDLPTTDDMVQDSFETFRKTVNDYDPTRNVKFHTLLHTYVDQYLNNKRKETKAKGRAPTIEIWDDTKKEYRDVVVDPLSIYDPANKGGFGGGRESDRPKEIVDFIQEALSERPDWQMHYDHLVNLIDQELTTDKKKDVFRKLLEHGLHSKRLKNIREELGLKPSELSNILGRDIYPAVVKVLRESDPSFQAPSLEPEAPEAIPAEPAVEPAPESAAAQELASE